MTENQNPNDDMNKTQMLQEKTVSNANNSKKTGKSTSTAHTDFRISQALYKTILTNLQVILVVFMVALIGWLVWYLSPLTATNTTYNAEAHEKAGGRDRRPNGAAAHRGCVLPDVVGAAMSGGELLLRGEETSAPTAVSAEGIPTN